MLLGIIHRCLVVCQIIPKFALQKCVFIRIGALPAA